MARWVEPTAQALLRGGCALARRTLDTCRHLRSRALRGPATAPVEGLFSPEESRRLAALPRYQPGSATSRLGRIHFVDACTLLGGEREIYQEQVYAFAPAADPPIVVDCGANIGLASLWFASRFDRARVLAFEADPDIFERLKQNIVSCGFTDRIEPYHRAIWRDAGGVTFDQEGGFSGQISRHGHALVKAKVSVASTTIEAILAGLPRVDLLKVDIEGAECEIFNRRLDLSRVARVFLEYHAHVDEPQVLPEILSNLRAEGFRFHIREARPAARPFLGVDDMLGWDLQLNVYAYR